MLLVAIVLESFSLRTAVREATPHRGSQTWPQFVRRAKSPELPVVLLEDTGALVGLGIALVGITVAELTGDPRWDAAGSLGIGALLGVIAVVLAIEMKSLLIGESVTPEFDEQIRTAMTDGPEVERIIHLRTMHLGPDDVLVAAKVEFTCDTMPALAHAIDTVEARVRALVPIARLIFIEPDIFRSSQSTDTESTDTEGTS